MAVYFIIIAVVYPYYAPGGYPRIGEVKYAFFRMASLVMLAVAAVFAGMSLFLRRDKERISEHCRWASVTDWFAYGYLLAAVLSYLCSDYRENALWGMEGWRTGLVSQMIFVAVYFLFSRCFFCTTGEFCAAGEVCRRERSFGGMLSEKSAGWLILWLAASAGVFMLGILNRYSLYPIAMEGQTPVFLSTLGNINWFCGYWSITVPAGMTLYWCSESRRERTVTGIYSVVAMLAGVVQGSSSAYLVFGVVFAVLIALSRKEKKARVLELGILFFLSCQIGRVMRYIPGLWYNYGSSTYETGSGITDVLLGSNAALWALLVLLLCYGTMRALEKKSIKAERRGRLVITAAAMLCGVILVMVYHHNLLYKEEWGNGRGTAWNCSVEAWRGFSTVHKIVGVGPDCFPYAVYEQPETAEKLVERFGRQRLTNAHNESLTRLVNTGILGFVCHAGFMLAGVVRYLRGADRQPLLYVCAVCLIAYMAHNMVSFEQILSTPYVYMMAGIGEGMLRDGCREDEESCAGRSTRGR